jgi:DNA-binding transcriptional MerR regulator
MKKALAQITFDFSAPPDDVPVVLEEKKEIVTPTVPQKIYTEPAVETVVATTSIEIGANTDKEEKLSAKKIKENKNPVTEKSTGKRGRKSLKDYDGATAIINIPPDEELFKKQYYSIGDVAEMFNEKQSLIRFWEIEFDILQPRKNRKGDRFFRPIDVKNLEMIYDLLRRRKFTIEGAKDYLKKNKRAEEKYAAIQSLEKIKGFLLELKASL